MVELDAAAIEGASPSRPWRGRRKGWVFRILCLVLIPAMLLGGVEVGLRVAGFGYPTCFFRHDVIQDREVFRDNPYYGWLFFSPALSRMPIPFQFDRVKAAGTVRIVVVGGSAAAGDPEPAYSFSRILEVMLSHRYPERRFEVVNAAVTAANSHVVRHIARELDDKAPDVLVIYMGNNEVVGPYGPGTVFTRTDAGVDRIRASIALRRLKISQLVETLGRAVRGGNEGPRAWSGMEMFLDRSFAWGDPALDSVYDAFEQNLHDIVAAGQAAGARVLVATVASSLRDCPPFASTMGPPVEAATRPRWEASVREADTLAAAGQYEAACSAYRSALSVDDGRADLHYRLAECLKQSASWDEAGPVYRRALDLDRLRFRADSRVNAIIREQTARQDARAPDLVDIEAVAADASPGRVPGAELFVDHVHFTFDGNYLVARTLLDAIDRSLPSLGGGTDAGAVPGPEACREALAYTQFDDARIADLILKRKQRPPFLDQIGHDSERDRLARTAAEKEASRLASSREDARRYEEAIRQHPSDWYLLTGFARLLMDQGQFNEAAEALERAIERYPYRPEGVYEFAKATAAAGRDIEASRLADRIRKIEPPTSDAALLKQAAYDLLTHGQSDGAAALYASALKTAPDDGEAYAGSGTALLAAGRHDAAEAPLLEAVRRLPDAAEALNALGSLRAHGGNMAEAMALFERSHRADPDYVPARENLARARVQTGRALAAQGDAAAAVAAYRKALEAMPEWNEAMVELAMVLATHPDPDIHDYPEAVRLAELACPNPEEADVAAMTALSTAYARTGRIEEAIRIAASARQKASTEDDRRTQAYLDTLLDHLTPFDPARSP